MAGIVVVGAGAAGLVCAWRLKRAGHDVQVLEQALHVGGRLRSESHGPHRIHVGAGFVTDGQRNVMSLATALGLSEKIVQLGKDATVPGRVLRDGAFEDCSLGSGLGALRSRLLSPGSRLRLGRLAAEVVRRRDRLDPVQPERAARLEDGEEMPSFAARVAGEAARDQLLAPVMSALFGCEPEEMSAAFFLLCLRSLGQGAEPMTFEGGLSRLTAELARSVPVRTSCEVYSVETQRGGARVRYRGAGRERSFLADAVVIAVPGPAVLDLCRDLTPDEKTFFGSVRYAPGIQVDLMLDEAPKDLGFGTCFARGEGIGLRAIFQSQLEPGADPEGSARLTVQLGDTAVRRLAHAKDEEIVGWTLDAIARTPLGLLAAHDSVVNRWQHARPIFPRGALSRLEHFDVRIGRSPRLVFAGDYLIGPTVEGALTSGMQAASRVVQSLDDTGLAGIQTRLCHEP
jgi:oxygen-dependent protoporphyrinogen oxidase